MSGGKKAHVVLSGAYSDRWPVAVFHDAEKAATYAEAYGYDLAEVELDPEVEEISRGLRHYEVWFTYGRAGEGAPWGMPRITASVCDEDTEDRIYTSERRDALFPTNILESYSARVVVWARAEDDAREKARVRITVKEWWPR